jgi:hypothetical protein
MVWLAQMRAFEASKFNGSKPPDFSVYVATRQASH